MTNIITLIPIGLFLLIFLMLLGRFILFRRVAQKEYKRFSTLLGSSKETLTQEDLILEMARSYEKSGNREKAIEHYDLYLFKKKSSDPEILFTIGNLYGIESLDKAREYWGKSAEQGYQPAIEMLNSIDESEKNLS